jgi:HEAT repeat protein
MVRGPVLVAALAAALFTSSAGLAQPSVEKEKEIARWTALLKSKDVDQRRQAAEALGKYGADAKGAVNGLLFALRDTDTFVRRFSARALGSIGADAKAGIPHLVPMLRSATREEAVEASEALVKIGPATIPTMITLLKDKEPVIALAAAKVLGRLGPDAKDAVENLAYLFRNPTKGQGATELEIRIAVAETLGNIGPAAKPAVEDLKPAVEIKNPNRELLQAVNTALKKIGEKPAKPKP